MSPVEPKSPVEGAGVPNKLLVGAELDDEGVDEGVIDAAGVPNKPAEEDTPPNKPPVEIGAAEGAGAGVEVVTAVSSGGGVTGFGATSADEETAEERAGAASDPPNSPPPPPPKDPADDVVAPPKENVKGFVASAFSSPPLSFAGLP